MLAASRDVCWLALTREIGDKWCIAYALLTLGDATWGCNGVKEAELLYQEGIDLLRVVEDKSLLAYPLRRLGYLALLQGKFDQALTDLLRASQNMARDDSVVFEHIGDTYLKLNRVTQALEAWQKALTLEPQNKKLAEKIDNAKTKMSKGKTVNPNPRQ